MGLAKWIIDYLYLVIPIFFSGFLAAIGSFFTLSYFDQFGQIIMLSAALALFQLAMTGGFFIGADMAGRYAGLVFAICNTVGQLSGVLNPVAVAWLVPNVSVPLDRLTTKLTILQISIELRARSALVFDGH